MDTYFSFSADRQRMLCEEAQGRLGLAPASIEKDFWVCWTLRELFSLPEWGDQLTFKGGTSLSKGWQLISRFSEDIDVVINRDFLGFGGERLSNKQLKRLPKECSRRVLEELQPVLAKRLGDVIPDGMTWDLEPAAEAEDPDQQTLLFQYPSLFSGSITYLRPVVKIELGARSDTEPVEAPVIRPYLAEAFPDLLRDSTFPIRTVAARRTFWEKSMLLHEETFRPPDKRRKTRLSRHYYDLWCLITKDIAAQAMADHDLFDHCARHRQLFFKQSWVDYGTLHKGSLRLIPLPEQLDEWRKDYAAMREEMFFEDPPTFDEILAVVEQFENKFNGLL